MYRDGVGDTTEN